MTAKLKFKNDEGHALESITVFHNKEEGWINVLTCRVRGDVIKPLSVSISNYSEEKLKYWLDRASYSPDIYVFSARRSIGG